MEFVLRRENLMQIKSEFSWKKLTFYSSAIEDDAVKYVGHDGIVLSGRSLCWVEDGVEKIRFFSDMLNGLCFFLQFLKKHLLYYRLLNAESPLGFDLYEQLPPMRLKYLQMVTQKENEENAPALVS